VKVEYVSREVDGWLTREITINAGDCSAGVNGGGKPGHMAAPE